MKTLNPVDPISSTFRLLVGCLLLTAKQQAAVDCIRGRLGGALPGNDLPPASAAILEEGLHALTGKTEPFYELMIWKSQETKVYDVTLPEGATLEKAGVAATKRFLPD